MSIRGQALARNTVLNLIGLGAPLLVAIFTIPLLIRGLGTDRFGVLTLAWIVAGYFNLFDLGLGRALTKLVSEKLGAGKEGEVPAVVWTAFVLMGILGIIGALVVALISSWLVHSVIKIPVLLQKETLKAFYLLSVSIPFIISTVGLRGVLEAYQRFDLTNAVRIPLGIFIFIGPLAVLPFSKSLFPVVAVLVAGRFLAWGVHFLMCMSLVPALRHNMKVRQEMVRPLVSFGGWMTVSSIVGPLMLYIDRFLIAGYLSVSSVAYYTTPYEVVTKLLIIPAAILGVLFPAFSFSFHQDRKRANYLYSQRVKYVCLIMLPIVLSIALFAEQGLKLWLNEEFAANSSRVAQLLVAGVFFNSLGLISQSFVQATGRPDLTAKLHLIELPLYLTYLWFLLRNFGINGAASAWLIRVLISALVLAILARLAVKKKK